MEKYIRDEDGNLLVVLGREYRNKTHPKSIGVAVGCIQALHSHPKIVVERCRFDEVSQWVTDLCNVEPVPVEEKETTPNGRG